MLFSEPAFFLFFACYFAVHLIVPPEKRIYLIIVGSTVFYAWWRVDFIWLPYLLTLIGWGGALWLSSTTERQPRTRRLICVVVVLFLPLAIVKYAYFFASSATKLVPSIATSMGDISVLRFGLPLGISFITFTMTAYVVDVFRGRYQADQRLHYVLGYILFFPHLIAGPILRPNELLPQFATKRRALDARFVLGFAIFTLGLVKKLVFADSLAGIVEEVYSGTASPNGWQYWLAVNAFSAQIYCDFSGYTDMAIGLAYLLRIRLPHNFLRPYTAASIIEFWRRWHITLSFWLRDYLYIPLGGNRHGPARRMLNLLITMVLGGLWHGAAWTFVMWGLLHGVALSVVHLLRKAAPGLLRYLPASGATVLTYVFVTLAWIFFRAPDFSTAWKVLSHLFIGPWDDLPIIAGAHVFEIMLIGVFLLSHRFDRHSAIRYAVHKFPRLPVVAATLFFFILAVAASQGNSGRFIYFDF